MFKNNKILYMKNLLINCDILKIMDAFDYQQIIIYFKEYLANSQYLIIFLIKIFLL